MCTLVCVCVCSHILLLFCVCFGASRTKRIWAASLSLALLFLQHCQPEHIQPCTDTIYDSYHQHPLSLLDELAHLPRSPGLPQLDAGLHLRAHLPVPELYAHQLWCAVLHFLVFQFRNDGTGLFSIDHGTTLCRVFVCMHAEYTVADSSWHESRYAHRPQPLSSVSS